MGDEALDAARAESTGERRSFAVRGERFSLLADPPQWSFLELARSGSVSLDPDATPAEQTQAFAAIYDFFHDVIDPADWGRFRRYMIKTRIPLEEISDSVLGDVVAIVVGRPTEPPSPSEPSPSPNGTSSTDGSPTKEPAALQA